MTFRALCRWTALSLVMVNFACVDGDGGPTSLEDLPPDLVVTWFATSLSVDGAELTDLGTRLKVTFAADGTYLFEATGDVTGFICDPGQLDCEIDGTFTASTSEVVFDPGNDPATLSAVLTTNNLRLTGTPDGLSVDLSFVVPPFPDLIGSWLATDVLDDTGPVMEGGSTTTLAFTFEADGTFHYASTFSPIGLFCDLSPHCEGAGTYVADSLTQEISFNPDDAPDVLQLAVDGSQLLLLGDLDGTLYDMNFQKVMEPSPGEQGSWWAIVLSLGGEDLTETGAVHEFQLDGLSYSSLLLADNPPQALCGAGSVPPNCDASGGYVVSPSELEFADGLEAGPLRLAFEATGITMRLSGMIGGQAADFRYARVPAFFQGLANE